MANYLGHTEKQITEAGIESLAQYATELAAAGMSENDVVRGVAQAAFVLGGGIEGVYDVSEIRGDDTIDPSGHFVDVCVYRPELMQDDESDYIQGIHRDAPIHRFEAADGTVGNLDSIIGY